MKPGDWNCPICNVIIFRSKNECFKCKSKKTEEVIKQHPYTNEIYEKIKKDLYEDIEKDRKNQRNLKIQQAINEGLPQLYYVTSCSICKNQHNPNPHNCWKYS